jgi:hypothetical protein
LAFSIILGALNEAGVASTQRGTPPNFWPRRHGWRGLGLMVRPTDCAKAVEAVRRMPEEQPADDETADS